MLADQLKKSLPAQLQRSLSLHVFYSNWGLKLKQQSCNGLLTVEASMMESRISFIIFGIHISFQRQKLLSSLLVSNNGR